MIKNNNNPKPRAPQGGAQQQQTQKTRRSTRKGRTRNQKGTSKSPFLLVSPALEHGFHNVSRWMTWLPISLKNAAKCDKWYQLQNHSITESLNANGAREKPPMAIPVHAASLSVEQKPNLKEESWFVNSVKQSWRPSGYPESTVKPSIHG